MKLRRGLHQARLVELVRDHQEGLWRYLRYLGCSEQDIDDVLQDTFLAVWRKPFEFRGPAAARVYLRTAARNQFLMLLRRRGSSVPATLPDDLEVAEEIWMRYVGEDDGNRFTESLRFCLGRLSLRVRYATELAYGSLMSRQEAASTLGMTINGLKSMLRRTRASLRTCIQSREET